MSRTFLLNQAATSSDQLAATGGLGAVHLSDGSLVFVAANSTSAGPVTLYRATGDRTAPVSLGTMSSYYGSLYSYAVVRDPSDNIYVVTGGSTANTTTVYVLKRTGTGTWAAPVRLTFAAPGLTTTGEYPRGVAATWCNTGGGTAAGGHLLVMVIGNAGTGGYVILDAGALLAATPAATVTASGAAPTFMGALGYYSESGFTLEADGFGAASGLSLAPSGSALTAVVVGRWVVTSAGVLSTNSALETLTVGASYDQRARLLRYAAGAWLLVTHTGTGGLTAHPFAATGRLGAGVAVGAPAGWSTSVGARGWDAFVDASASGRVWVLAADWTPYTTGLAPAARVALDVVAGVPTWAASTVTADSVPTYPSSAPGVQHLAVVAHPVSRTLDWRAHVATDTSNSNATGFALSTNRPPSAAITAPAAEAVVDLTKTVRVAWTSTDPDGDAQAGYEVYYRVAGTSGWAVATATGATGALSYWDAPPNTFGGRIEVQVRTLDAFGGASDRSASRFFRATGPAVTSAGAGSTVSARAILLAALSQIGAPAQLADKAGTLWQRLRHLVDTPTVPPVTVTGTSKSVRHTTANVWVELLPSAPADLLATSLLIGNNYSTLAPLAVEVGVGAAGSEVSIARYVVVSQQTYGGVQQGPQSMPVALRIAAGERVSMKNSDAAASGSGYSGLEYQPR